MVVNIVVNIIFLLSGRLFYVGKTYLIDVGYAQLKIVFHGVKIKLLA